MDTYNDRRMLNNDVIKYFLNKHRDGFQRDMNDKRRALKGVKS